MRDSYRKGDISALIVLSVFPLFAYLEPLLDHRLLGPGDGVALHLPLRTEAFRAYREFSWPFLNTKEFLVTPLLAAYRGGVFHPLTILLAPFEPFSSFQALVVISMAMTGVVTYFYLKRLGSGARGAFVGALCFAYGPYLLGHFEDTATLAAAPMLPLVLLTAESHINRGSASRLVGLAVSIALLVFSGSPEALRACGALLFGRLLLGHTLGKSPRTPSPAATGLAVLLGLALSALQWLPTLDLLATAGRQVTGLVATAPDAVPGLTGLILKTVSHTPAASLAIASLPLLFERLQVRVLLLAVLAALALQVGRGPLIAPGALPLVVEFALAALAGLALDEQWRERRTARGRRLRAYFLVASLASAGVLSVAAATLGGLPDRLSAAVGVYAIALIAYFALADGESEIAASVFLLPLAVSFALQPSSREVFKDAPTRAQLVAGTPTRHAVDLALRDQGPAPRILSLVTKFPTDLALDLGFAGYGALAPRTQANGYDPLAPVVVRRVFGEMGARGTLTGRSFMPDPERLRQWSIAAVQIPTAALTDRDDEALDLSLQPGARYTVPVPVSRLRKVTLDVAGGEGARIEIFARSNNTREILLGQAVVSRGTASVSSPSYRADAVVLVPIGATSPVRVVGMAIEADDGKVQEPSRLSIYLSQPAFEEVATTPQVRAFRVIGAMPLVSGATEIAPPSGPSPGGHLTLRGAPGSTVEVAIPFLEGWGGADGIEGVRGRLRATVGASGQVDLRYIPPLFQPGLRLAALGVLLSVGLLVRPSILAPLLKTRREERK